MYPKKLVALCGATVLLALLCAVPALAAKGPAVSVRVEGVSKTLELPTQVRLGAGSLTRFGAPKGSCAVRTAAGALDSATHHHWKGIWEKSFGDYEITSIFGETHTFSSKYFWELFVNNVAASSGACGTKLKARAQVLFAAVPNSVSATAAEYPLRLSAAHSVVGGKAFTVKVVWFNAAGMAKPLSGAIVSGDGVKSVKTNRHGVATVTAQKHGTLVLRATHKGFIRAAPVAVVVA
jgi:hypothetical protein